MAKLTKNNNGKQIQPKLGISDVSGSWLDHHILNEDSKIDGVIIKHSPAPEIYGGVTIQTSIGNFAIVKEHQEEAAIVKCLKCRCFYNAT